MSKPKTTPEEITEANLSVSCPESLKGKAQCRPAAQPGHPNCWALS